METLLNIFILIYPIIGVIVFRLQGILNKKGIIDWGPDYIFWGSIFWPIAVIIELIKFLFKKLK